MTDDEPNYRRQRRLQAATWNDLDKLDASRAPHGAVPRHCGLTGCHITADHIAHVPSLDPVRGGAPLTKHPYDGHLHVNHGHSRCALCDVLLMPTYRPHQTDR